MLQKNHLWWEQKCMIWTWTSKSKCIYSAFGIIYSEMMRQKLVSTSLPNTMVGQSSNYLFNLNPEWLSRIKMKHLLQASQLTNLSHISPKTVPGPALSLYALKTSSHCIWLLLRSKFHCHILSIFSKHLTNANANGANSLGLLWMANLSWRNVQRPRDYQPHTLLSSHATVSKTHRRLQ